MTPLELERTAATVERFLNALRLADGRERTQIESALVAWLLADTGRQGHYVIYQSGRIDCFSGQTGGNAPRALQTFALPNVNEPGTLWCNSRKLSLIDGASWSASGNMQMLGTAGLLLTLPGLAGSALANEPPPRKQGDGGGGSGSYNNNNNNNNNG